MIHRQPPQGTGARAPRLLAVALVVGAAVGLGACGATKDDGGGSGGGGKTTIAYLAPAFNVPFWSWMADGVKRTGRQEGFKVVAYDSKNDAATQLSNAQDAITKQVDAIVLSPTDSSTAKAVEQAAKRQKIPVVISDVGSEAPDYLAYLTSTHEEGSYKAGLALAEQMKQDGNAGKPVAELTIPLSRVTGRQRAAGFARAMKETGHEIVQQLQEKNDTTAENEAIVRDIANAHPEIRGFFAQSDNGTNAALSAFKSKPDVAITGFDISPATLKLVQSGRINAISAQQPVTIGAQAAKVAFDYVTKKVKPKKNILVPTILVDKENSSAAALDGKAFVQGG